MAHRISPLRRAHSGGPESGRRLGRAQQIGRGAATVVAALALALAGCKEGPSPEAQRIDQLNLKIQQLEQRLNKLASERQDGADQRGKPPVGAIKSLTVRTGTEDDRLRIYWADGSTTDLPCTKEQATFVCG
jgi:outer membrane murein-binding lipoprotein Lpp